MIEQQDYIDHLEYINVLLGPIIETQAIVDEYIQALHDRMPVINEYERFFI